MPERSRALPPNHPTKLGTRGRAVSEDVAADIAVQSEIESRLRERRAAQPTPELGALTVGHLRALLSWPAHLATDESR